MTHEESLEEVDFPLVMAWKTRLQRFPWACRERLQLSIAWRQTLGDLQNEDLGRKADSGNLPCILKALCMYVCFIYMRICIKAAKLRSCPNPNLAVLGTLFPKRFSFSVRTSAEAGERCSVTSHSVCRDQPLQPILQPWQCRWTLRDVFAAKSAVASATDLISHRHNRAAWSS